MAARLKKIALIALVVIGLDQLLKALAVSYLAAGPVSVIDGFFDLVLVYNQGAAFGSFSQWAHSRWLLAGLTVIALGVAAWIGLGPTGRVRAVQICIGLIAGGALGNLIDRVRLGVVVDFVYLHAGSFQWPAFNLADAAISVGGVYLGWLLLRGKV